MLGDPGLRLRDVNMTLECFKGQGFCTHLQDDVIFSP